MPSRQHPGQIPAERWLGKWQDVFHLHPIGSAAYAKIPKEDALHYELIFNNKTDGTIGPEIKSNTPIPNAEVPAPTPAPVHEPFPIAPRHRATDAQNGQRPQNMQLFNLQQLNTSTAPPAPPPPPHCSGRVSKQMAAAAASAELTNHKQDAREMGEEWAGNNPTQISTAYTQAVPVYDMDLDLLNFYQQHMAHFQTNLSKYVALMAKEENKAYIPKSSTDTIGEVRAPGSGLIRGFGSEVGSVRIVFYRTKPDTAAEAKPKAVRRSKNEKKTDSLLPEEKPEKKAEIDDLSSTLDQYIIRDVGASHSESTEIKQGLYPPPGGNASTVKGGGQRKTAWQWRLAVILFKDHPDYGAAFNLALNPPAKQTVSKAQAPWADKIKNRLKKMSTIVRGHMETLGKTGEGIQHASEIDESKGGALVNKWAEVKADCPWFFEMRNIIAERPNLVPTGIGHSSSSINMSVLQSVNEDDKVDEAADGEADLTSEAGLTSKTGILEDDVANEIMDMSDVKEKEDGWNVEEKFKERGGKRKAVDSDNTDSKTHARPGSSKPAVVKLKAKKSRLEEFSLTAQAEEATKQQEINLDKAKVESAALIKVENKKAESAKTKEKYSLRQDKRGMEKEIKIERMRLKQAYKMEKLHLSAQGGQMGQGQAPGYQGSQALSYTEHSASLPPAQMVYTQHSASVPPEGLSSIMVNDYPPSHSTSSSTSHISAVHDNYCMSRQDVSGTQNMDFDMNSSAKIGGVDDDFYATTSNTFLPPPRQLSDS
ncbi:hypothetical protein B0H34DRAFT_673077 [Crassisporium funariophilum]|nr:hypothetical protein B0H34DRAFT_673077 [Crassisporium funariophilum]